MIKKYLNECSPSQSEDPQKQNNKGLLWLSIGENCLPDDILKRHNKKSFSTLFSACRSNIDYILQLEIQGYETLLDKERLIKADAWGASVVRSTAVTRSDPIFDEAHRLGFEFTHQDTLLNEEHRASALRRICRLNASKGQKDIIFLYHHRINKNSNINLLKEKLFKLSSIYSSAETKCIIALFYQVVDKASMKYLEKKYAGGWLCEYIFHTPESWAGDDPETFWARKDEDLICQMLFDVEEFFTSEKKGDCAVDGSKSLGSVVISGLDEQATFAAVGASKDSALAIDWLPEAEFIAKANVAEYCARQCVWLYRAPWALLAQGGSQPSAEVLAQWQAQQRAVLQLRRHLRQRLVLVNVDRVASPLLAERFGVPFIEGALPDEKPAAPLLSTLANLFEQMAPECWELYEALEAAAWLPEGEPEFRTNRALPRAAQLTELLDLVRAGKQLAAVSQRLDARETELQQLHEHLSNAQAASETAEQQARQQLIEHQQALQAAQSQAEALQAEKQSLTEENELLLNQLHQVQEELEKHYLDAVSLKKKQAALEKELAQTKADHQQASKELAAASGKATEAEKARQKLAGELASLQKEKAELQAKAQSDAEENELLLNQLHQVQEELENYYLANREILTVMGQSEQTLHRARGVIGRMAAHG